MKGNENVTPSCPMADLLKIIGGKWKIYILWILNTGTRRFGQLQRELGHITQAMLTKQLRELEKDGFISRYVYQEVPPKVEYSLTELGRRFSPVLEQMYAWGQDNLKNCPPPSAKKEGKASSPLEEGRRF